MSRIISWNERKSWSIQHDCTMARISGFDDRNQEHWTMIETGKGYADRRKDAIEMLQESIERGDLPGEMKNAQQIQITKPIDAGGCAQSCISQENRRTSQGGEGIHIGAAW